MVDYNDQYKIEVCIPEEYLDELIAELQSIGAGRILNHECMTISDVENLYKRLPGSMDDMDVEIGKVIRKKEKKLEVKIDSSILGKVIGSVMKIHPYENPIMNIIPLL